MLDKKLSKTHLRQQMAQKRGEVSPAEKHAAGQGLAKYVLGDPASFQDKIIALFSPINDEIDVQPLYAALKPLASNLALPCVREDKSMVFRAWDGTHQGRDAMGIVTGTGEDITPDIVFVPFLVFNRDGHRLGYGAGYYDKALALLPGVRTIGLGFSWQEAPDIPVEPHDVPLNEIWTEKERIYAPKR